MLKGCLGRQVFLVRQLWQLGSNRWPLWGVLQHPDLIRCTSANVAEEQLQIIYRRTGGILFT